MNIVNINGHLTESQIDEALMGALDRHVASHIASCEQCAERVTEARVPMASFKAVSTAWSERRSATLPQISMQDAARPLRLTWGAAAVTAMLGFIIAVPVTQHHERVMDAQKNVVSGQQMAAVSTAPLLPLAATTPSAHEGEARTRTIVAKNSDDDQITNDNQMLDVIDQELGSESPAALEVQPVRERATLRTVTFTEQN